MLPQKQITHTKSTQLKANKKHTVLSLFSGCGGMDLGFEGGFIIHRQSVNEKIHSDFISEYLANDFVRLKETSFQTVFSNDILPEARAAWIYNFSKLGYDAVNIFHPESIVDLVKAHWETGDIFPKDIDIVTGGFPCQDFSVAGKRKGFDSKKDHKGNQRTNDEPSEENRGRLYFWMKQVIDIVKPKIFVAENVKGLTNLGDVKDIIRNDFSSADENGYIVLNPQVLHAADYGVPQSRERVIFIGIRKNCLTAKARHYLSQENIPSEYNPYPPITHNYHNGDCELTQYQTVRNVFAHLVEPQMSADLSQKFYSHAKYMGKHCQGQSEVDLDGIGPTIRSEHHGNIEFRRLSTEHNGKYIEELKKGLPERRLTPRECAMIQTFPPDFEFVLNKTQLQPLAVSTSGAYKIVGNAVPPMLAYNIARRIESIWNLYFNQE